MNAIQLVLFPGLVKPQVYREMTLEQVREYLDHVPHISQGGCGVAALAMVRWLKKTGQLVEPKPFQILRWHRSLFPWQHVAIRYNNQLCDCSQDRDWKGWEAVEAMNETEMVDFVNSDVWNDAFRRKRWLPQIEKALGIDLSDIRRSF